MLLLCRLSLLGLLLLRLSQHRLRRVRVGFVGANVASDVVGPPLGAEQARHKRMSDSLSKVETKPAQCFAWRCLPDTVDPRGPKAK
jgi:hypothetical protein